MAKQEKYTMALFKINGHYITYVEGYIEAENANEAQHKAKYGRHWKINPNAIPVQELAVNYVTEVNDISPYSTLKVQLFRKENNEEH